VPPGTIVGLVGSDGAGKTTLLRMIAAMIPPTSGRIAVGGLDAVAARGRVKELLGYMPQRFALYPDLTVAENLDFCMDVYGVTGAERRRRRERFLGFSNLLPFVDRRAADLSGGMKQKLGLACVLVHHPRLLVLDEPTNGVDPVSRREFWGILDDMRREGMTALVATAYLDEGERCDRVLILHNGRLLADAPPAEVRAGHADLEQAMIERIRAADEGLSHDAFGA
jgi:ABC-2 type transport system ATP-binding protein